MLWCCSYYTQQHHRLICHVSCCLVILNRTNSVMCHSAAELEILSWHQYINARVTIPDIKIVFHADEITSMRYHFLVNLFALWDWKHLRVVLWIMCYVGFMFIEITRIASSLNRKFGVLTWGNIKMLQL